MDKFDVENQQRDTLASLLRSFRGNLQGMVWAKRSPQSQLLVNMQPTWGVDAGAAAIHEKIRQMISAGAGVVISQNLDEIFATSDRIAVISQGRLCAPTTAGVTEEVGLLMKTTVPARTRLSRLKPGRHSQPVPPGYRRYWRWRLQP